MEEEKPKKQRARPRAGVYVYRRKRTDQVRWVVERRRSDDEPKSYRIFEQRKDAEDYAAELRRSIAAEAEPVKVRATVEEVWHIYRARAAMRLRPGALETYAGSMTKHILPYIGDTPVADLDAPRVRRLIDELLMSGVNPKTVKNAIGALRSSLGMLVDEGVLPVNPASLQRGWIPVRHPEPKSLTRMQFREFMAAAKGEPLYPLIEFLAFTGVRLGEACALLWNDVDLERKTAVIRRSVRLARESQPKTRFGMRPVDLPTGLAELLAGLPSREKGELVFPDSKGSYLRARFIHHVFRRISRRAGLPPVHPHMLRHTWATLMIEQGTPLNYVSRALGHHSTAFTAGVYATAQPESRHEDVDRLANLALLNAPVDEKLH